jgi:hypothetical protein
MANRLRFLKTVLLRPVGLVAMGIWTLFSAFATFRDNFLPTDIKERWQTLALIPGWRWHVWVIGALLIVLVIVFESAYRLYNRLDVEASSHADFKRVIDVLGRFLERGRILADKCREEKEPPPREEADALEHEVEQFLVEHLGASYVARFRSGANLPMTMTSIRSSEHVKIWAGLERGKARLEQFLQELSIQSPKQFS